MELSPHNKYNKNNNSKIYREVYNERKQVLRLNEENDRKPITKDKEEYVKIPKMYLDVLREQNERLIKEFNKEQKHHEDEVKRFEKIITNFIIMNGIIMAIWFILNWITTIFFS